ncbi:MAG: porin family protein [Dokdonia sp.]
MASSMSLFAQEEETPIAVIDSLYREDQLYFGLSLDLLLNTPTDFEQNGFSGSFQAGFVRDMPINKARNKAIGIGLGLAVDVFNQNLFIGEETDGETTIYNVLGNDINRDRNRFSYYTLEMPIEYRWRTSTPTEYSFWRVYGGIQLGYIYYAKASFKQPGNTVIQTDIPELNKLQYGLTFAFGYSAFNLKVYYGLNTLFDQNATTLTDQAVNLQVLRLGIQFYFL